MNRKKGNVTVDLKDLYMQWSYYKKLCVYILKYRLKDRIVR